MEGMAYSEDFRRKVVEGVKNGKVTITEIAEQLAIARQTVYNWMKLDKTEGSLKHNTSPGRPSKIQDLEAFEKTVQEHSDKTLPEIAAKCGDGVSANMVRYALDKIGYTQKKRPFSTKNETNNSELLF